MSCEETLKRMRDQILSLETELEAMRRENKRLLDNYRYLARRPDNAPASESNRSYHSPNINPTDHGGTG
jgi:hypothetical protein